MSLVLLPSLLLAGSAIGLASWRVYALGVRARVDLDSFRTALQHHLHADDRPGALVLCGGLPTAWAAASARTLLPLAGAEMSAQAWRSELDEQLAIYRFRAQAGLAALFTLSRMSLPLALGSAIFVLSGAFANANAESAQRALSTAVECLVTGMLSMLFCRSSLTLLQRQARERLQEIHAVANALRM